MPPVFGADLKVLPGHVPQAVSNLSPIGRLAETNELRLAIGLPLRDPAGLESFVARVSDPADPIFRQFLTREELTARFGPTEMDYEAVKEFAESNGLVIALTNANRLLLDVTGPASAVEKAFHITLRRYRYPAEARDFFAPDTEPMVDAALPVVDIEGLSDFWRPHSHSTRRPGMEGATAAPNSGTAPDQSGDFIGDDFRNAYAPGVTLTGAGQSVGLFECDAYFANDISNYAYFAGSGRTNIVITNELLDSFNGTPSSDNLEISMDIEMAMSIAPGLAKIVCFEGNPSHFVPNDILNAMLADSNIVNLSSSISWGPGGPSTTTDNIFKMMDAAGQSYFNASGDDQAYTTGANSVHGVDNTSLDTTPCSNPYITQVGGTTLAMNSPGASWASEVVWNWAVELGDSGVGSSGGISSHYSIPSWQTNVSNMAARGGSASYRNIPDVAANADHVFVIDENGDTNNGYIIGGTSAAAPLWAGFMALVNQQAAASGWKSAGFINPALYTIAAGSNYASCMHDVISGNNTWSKSPALFYATNNYDLCTGLGTMNGSNLITALAQSATTFSNLTASQSITYGTTGINLAGKISANVLGAIYPASGEKVTVTINGNAQTTMINDSTGDFSINYNPSAIAASATPYVITYSYGGDAWLNGATSAGTTLTVNKAALTVTPNAVSTTYNGTTLNTTAYSANTANYSFSGFQNGQTVSSAGVALNGLMAFNGSTSTAVKNAGTYTLASGTLALTAANYSMSFVNSTPNNYVITPKALTVSGITAGSTTYDGTTTAKLGGTAAFRTAEAAGSGTTSDGIPYAVDSVSAGGTVAGTLAARNVGNEAVTITGVTVTGAGNGNYTVTQQTGLTQNVTAKALTVSGITAGSTTYDGTTTAKLGGTAAFRTAEAAGSGTTSDGIPYAVDSVSAGGMAAGILAARNVGNEAVTITGVTVTGAGSGNYSVTQQAGLTQNVTAKALTVSGITAGSTIYDGTTTAKLGGAAAFQTAEAPGYGTTSDGIPYTVDSVSAGGTAAGILAARNVGNEAVTITGVTVTGAGNGNYTVTQQTGLTQNVTAKALTMSGLSVPSSKVYDGTTTATVSGSPGSLHSAEPPGSGSTNDGAPYSGDMVSITGAATGTYNSADVATASSVTFGDLSLTGAQAGNYSLTIQNAASAAITQAGLSITANAQSKTYGTALSLGSTAFSIGGGLVAPQTVTAVTLTASGGTAATDPVSGSPYAITPSAAIGADGFRAANYTITYNPGALTVNPLAVVLTGARAYDGTTNAAFGILSVSNLLASDDVIVASGDGGLASGDIGTNAITSVGTLTLGGAAAGNYTLSGAAGAVTVTPLPVVLTGTRPYDGTATALASILTMTNDADGTNLTLTGSAALAGASAGLQNILDFTGLALGGPAAANYTLTGASGSVTITTADPGVTTWPTASAITYGQMLASSTLSGGVAGAPGTFAFITPSASPNAGAASQAVTFTPADTTDYNTAAGAVSVTVNPAMLTPVVTVQGSKPYDGTTTAVITSSLLSPYVPGDSAATVNLGNSGAANYSDPNAGTGKSVTITGLSLSGPAAANYALSTTTVTTTAAITPAGVTVASGLTADDKVYDGTDTATLSLTNTVILTGLTGGDLGSVTLSTNGYVATFASSNATTNVPVSVAGLTLTGGDYTNYALAQPVLAADIDQATLTYVATDTNEPYGSTETNFSGDVTGFVAGETQSGATAGTLAFTSTTTPASPVGSYAINGSGLTASNYAFIQAEGNATALTIVLAGGSPYPDNLTNNTAFNYNCPAPQSVSGVVSGTGALVVSGAGTLTLTGANTYTGSTVINNGTLALGSGGSIADTGGITIGPGGTLDVSALGASATFTMPGTNFMAGGDAPATIVGPANGTVSLASLPITLTYDGLDPSLIIAQGVLLLDSNVFTINTFSGSALAAGSYDVIEQSNGDIAGAVTSAVTGTAIPASGTTNFLSISGGMVVLTILNTTAITLTGESSITYGDSLSIAATVSPAPPDGEAVVFYAGANPVSTNSMVGGVAGAVICCLGSSGQVAFTAAYPGDSTNAASTSAAFGVTVNPLPVVLTGSRPYDGTASAAAAILSVANLVSGDLVTVDSGSATLAGADVGTNAITSVGTLALGGPAAANYTLTGASGSVTISNPFSPFSITTMSLDMTGTNMVVCWQSVPGVAYTVLTNTSLFLPASWAVAGSPITATGTNTCFTLPGGIAGQTQVFVVIKQQ